MRQLLALALVSAALIALAVWMHRHPPAAP